MISSSFTAARNGALCDRAAARGSSTRELASSKLHLHRARRLIPRRKNDMASIIDSGVFFFGKHAGISMGVVLGIVLVVSSTDVPPIKRRMALKHARA